MGLAWAAISLFACYLGFSSATYEVNEQALLQLKRFSELSALTQLEGVVYQSDIAFKHALQDTVGIDVAKQFEGEILQASTTMNGMLVLVGISSFIAAFHFSIGPVMWVLFSEIFLPEFEVLRYLPSLLSPVS